MCFFFTLGSWSRGVNPENVIVPFRAQSPPAASDGGGLAAFDGEQHAELSLARATASFRASHYGFRFPPENTASYLFINRGQNISSSHSVVIFFLLSQYKLKHAFILPKTQTGSTMTLHPWRMSCPGSITCFSAYFSPCPDCARQAAWRQH